MKITIVTITFNNTEGLLKTLSSVLVQTYSSIEYIIIDGGSTDNTLAVIEEYQHNIDFYVSEPDKGIYDAMNKGLDYSSGDFVIFLNAGDCFASENSLQNAVDQINCFNKVYFGRAIIKHNEISWLYPPKEIFNLEVGQKWSRKYVPNHQAILFPKHFYRSNKFDIRFQIRGDHEYKLRAMLNTGDFIFLDVTLSVFGLGGISSKAHRIGDVMTQIKESILISNIYYKYPEKLTEYFFALRFLIKYFFQKVLNYNSYTNLLHKLNQLRTKEFN